MLLLDEPDNFLDVPGKTWLEDRINESPDHPPTCAAGGIANTATRVVTVELGAAEHRVGASRGVRDLPRGAPGQFARFELRERWDEEHAKLGP